MGTRLSKKSIIHVNRQFIAINAKIGKNVLPCYTVKRGSRTRYGFAVEINGPSKLVDTREACQLSCGARAWIETDSPVKIIGDMSFTEAKKLLEGVGHAG